jgi:hypothetical protein
MISDKQNQSLINGLAIAQNAPKISHLFFADDSLIFCKANKEEAAHLKAIFEEYQRISGQQINMDKSEMTFSPKLYQHIKDDFHGILPLAITNNITKYLGMPTLIGHSKQVVFRFIMDKVRNKLKGWKEKHLSFAGRAVLISAVIQALPTYVMSNFMIPKSMCDQIEKAICRFWWGSKEGQQKIHWKARKELFKPKFQGGLGFRDMHLFNKAMLAKQVWRLQTDPNSLVGQCFKARYYPNTDILHSSQGRNASYAWQSIYQAIDLIHKGSCWKIGNGQLVNIWEDNWLVYQNGYKTFTPQANHYNINKVEDIMLLQHQKNWNTNLIDQIFLPFESDLIKQIPLIDVPMDDRLMWPYSKDGIYSVKIGYNLLQSWQEAERPSTTINTRNNTIWKKLWTLHTVPRHKMLLWRILQEAIPVRSKLNHRGVQCDIICPRCLEREETSDHTFMHCHHAAKIWFGSKLGINFNNNQRTFNDWLSYAINILKEDDISYIAAIINSIWFARNQQVFDLKDIDANTIIDRAQRSLQEFQVAMASQLPHKANSSHRSTTNTYTQRSTTHDEANKHWTRPDNDSIKVNSDANLVIDGRWGLGVACRNYQGELLAAATWEVPGYNEPALAEAFALYKAVLFAIECGFQKVIFECDCAHIISLINKDYTNPRSYLGNFVRGILGNKDRFCSSSFSSIRREANKVAHNLAALAHQEPNRIWFNETHPSIVPFLIMDLIH